MGWIYAFDHFFVAKQHRIGFLPSITNYYNIIFYLVLHGAEEHEPILRY